MSPFGRNSTPTVICLPGQQVSLTHEKSSLSAAGAGGQVTPRVSTASKVGIRNIRFLPRVVATFKQRNRGGGGAVNGSATFQGAVHVFELAPGGAWRHRAKIMPADIAPGDSFGFAIALGGMRLAVGSPFSDDLGSLSGKVYVFERQADGSWDQDAVLLASDGAAGDEFGYDVDLDGVIDLVF